MSLRRAAEKLGVHPTTLRRWADKGEMPVLRTPGGHRRFSVHDIEAFAQTRRPTQPTGDLEQVWAERALTHTRQELVNHSDEPWLVPLDDEERKQKRQLGRRLMGVILRYVSETDAGDDLLAEARSIGRLHAQSALEHRLPLVDALGAAMFFRDVLLGAAIQLPEAAHVRSEMNARLLRRINSLLNTVQLGIAETYDKARY
ncbi:MAG: helix-turn-helix domain-containing protein [Anaerolineales bacterium]